MNILIYFPYNLRTVEQQSVMEMLAKKSHKVVLLTTCKRGYLHEYVERFGVITEAMHKTKTPGSFRFYSDNYKKLKLVIKRYSIDVVIAHQQGPALIAGVLRKTKPFKLIYVRHNSDEDYQLNYRKAKWYNKIVNSLTPVKVAPSSVVHNFWRHQEKVFSQQIHRINYGYNFKQYEEPNPEEVEKIKKAYPASLKILSIARLVPAKRHNAMLSIVHRLVQEGIDCKFICLGTGPLENELIHKIHALNLQEHIYLLGRKENVFDFIAAADIFIHLSSSEASNSAVKEAGLCRTPVVVCRGVGDFEDYIINGENGFLVNKENPAEESYVILKNIAEGRVDIQKCGNLLFDTVTSAFNINNIGCDYEQLLNTVMKR